VSERRAKKERSKQCAQRNVQIEKQPRLHFSSERIENWVLVSL